MEYFFFISPTILMMMGLTTVTMQLMQDQTLEGRLEIADEILANKTIDLEEDYGYVIWSRDGYNGGYSGPFGGRDGEWSPSD